MDPPPGSGNATQRGLVLGLLGPVELNLLVAATAVLLTAILSALETGFKAWRASKPSTTGTAGTAGEPGAAGHADPPAAPA